MRLAHSCEVPHPRPLQHRRHMPGPILGNRGIQNLPAGETSPSRKVQQPGIILQGFKDLFHHYSLTASTVHCMNTVERAGSEPTGTPCPSVRHEGLLEPLRALCRADVDRLLDLAPHHLL